MTGYSPPMRWQDRLFGELINGEMPAALDLPTGLGKTSVMAIWLLARALANGKALTAIPRRLIYVVDRRAVVDQTTEEAEKLRDALACNAMRESKAKHLKGLAPDIREKAFATLRALKKSLGLEGCANLAISTLRGAHVDNREWLEDPAAPAIVVGTVDMIGSRLLFEGYGVSRKMRPYHAGLLGAAAALEADLLAECQRAGLPRPQMEVAKTFAQPGAGLSGFAKLRFHGAAAGPMLLGRDRHFGGGLFVTAR